MSRRPTREGWSKQNWLIVGQGVGTLLLTASGVGMFASALDASLSGLFGSTAIPSPSVRYWVAVGMWGSAKTRLVNGENHKVGGAAAGPRDLHCLESLR